MTTHVAVLKGGWSVEREVSLVSGAAVARALRSRDHQVTEIDVTPDIAAILGRLKPDVVFNALHGRFGEDGCIQGLLEILKIPYSHSGVTASAVAMDKMMAKDLFRIHDIPCAEDKNIRSDQLFVTDPLPRPFVVKPDNEGSSVGVVIIREGETFSSNQPGPWQSNREVMVERYLPGRELTVTVVDGKALAVTELKPKQGFYDYGAKYQTGMTDHILPADLKAEMTDRIMMLAQRVHNIVGCRGVTRADFRLDDGPNGDGIPYILEINTQPGMTPLSLVPEQARHCGMTFDQLVTWMVEDASCGR